MKAIYPNSARDFDRSASRQILDRRFGFSQTDAESLAVNFDGGDLIAAADEPSDFRQTAKLFRQRNCTARVRAPTEQLFRHDNQIGTERAAHSRIEAVILKRPAA